MNKELSFYGYSQLSEHDQYDLIFRNGEFINSTEKDSVRFVLYKLFGFYVEVSYNISDNKIFSLKSFLKAE